MLINPGPQSAPALPVDTAVTVTRGYATVVRSDIPPIQQDEGVRYTKGRPSDDEPYTGTYNPKRRRQGAHAQGDESVSLDPEREGSRQRRYADVIKRPEPTETTDDEQAIVEQLRARDLELRLHEQAHQRAGGTYAALSSYTLVPEESSVQAPQVATNVQHVMMDTLARMRLEEAQARVATLENERPLVSTLV